MQQTACDADRQTDRSLVEQGVHQQQPAVALLVLNIVNMQHKSSQGILRVQTQPQRETTKYICSNVAFYDLLLHALCIKTH